MKGLGLYSVAELACWLCFVLVRTSGPSLQLSDRLLLDARLLVELDTCMLLLLPPPACVPTPHIPSFPVSVWFPWSPGPGPAKPSREDAECADSLSCPTPLELLLQDV